VRAARCDIRRERRAFSAASLACCCEGCNRPARKSDARRDGPDNHALAVSLDLRSRRAGL
jgi:hypothetical protein